MAALVAGKKVNYENWIYSVGFGRSPVLERVHECKVRSGRFAPERRRRRICALSCTCGICRPCVGKRPRCRPNEREFFRAQLGQSFPGGKRNR
jgi:hypothetical protein